MLRKPCSVRKRSISSSGLIPGSTRRKTFRISSSSNTTERVRLLGADRARVAELAAEAGEALDRAELGHRPRAPWSVTPARIALHDLARERRRRSSSPSNSLALVAARDEELVDVVRARCRSASRRARATARLGLRRSTVSSTCECDDRRDFAPYQRCSA